MMFDEAQLEALGLRAARLGPTDSIVWPRSGRALGRHLERATPHMEEVGALHGWTEEPEPPRQATAPALTEAGVHVSLLVGRPGVITIEPAPGRHIQLKGPRLLAQHFDVNPDDPERYEVDLAQAGPVLAVTGAGGVACAFAGDRLFLAPIRFPFDPPVEPRIDPPLERWAETMDEWVASELRARIAADFWWHRLVAVGLFDRLRAGDSGAGREIYAWLMSVDRAAWPIVEEFAVAEAHATAALLMDACDDPDPDAPAWCDQVLVACHRRDDLEGVRRMLDEVGLGKELEAALKDLDEAGLAARYSLPWFEYPDERLRRVRQRDVDAWWVEIFDPEDES